MKLFRNPEVRLTAIIAAAMTAAAAGAAFFLSVRFGILMTVTCAAFCVLMYSRTRSRYKKIDALSQDIDRILHGNDNILPEKNTEGELSVLQSELQKMMLTLREQKAQLVSDKLLLSDSIADISHQIRTPLTSINLIVSLLCEPDLTDERRDRLVNELRGLLARIDWLITALLKISKLDTGTVVFKKEQLSLKELIDKASEPMLIPIELRGQTLNIDADGVFEGDISWTCEAVCNILKNCMEHTPSGGILSVDAQETPLYSQIVITDNGTGISPEDMPHIFERFYKGKNSSENSVGIGLALSRMIVTAQNGTLKAQSSPHGGTKFTMRFYKSIV